jgi:dihydroneopterin aldolase
MKSAVLKLNSLRLKARLGCFPAEKLRPQPVRLDIELRFPRLPRGAKTDRLADTLDYGMLADAVRKVGMLRHYNLVEHLAFEYFKQLKAKLPRNVKLKLTLTKERVPVAGLQGGASFCIGDSGS